MLVSLTVLLTDDKNNLITEAALAGFHESNTSLETQTIELSNQITENELCRTIFPVVANETAPVFMLDISKHSSVGKILARTMGVPCLKTSTSTTNEEIGWKSLNEVERSFLLTVLTPRAAILRMIKQVANHYRYKKVVIIYDESYSKFTVEPMNIIDGFLNRKLFSRSNIQERSR